MPSWLLVTFPSSGSLYLPPAALTSVTLSAANGSLSLLRTTGQCGHRLLHNIKHILCRGRLTNLPFSLRKANPLRHFVTLARRRRHTPCHYVTFPSQGDPLAKGGKRFFTAFRMTKSLNHKINFTQSFSFFCHNIYVIIPI